MSTTLGRIGMVIQDEYKSTTAYKPLDVVTHNRGSYIARQTTTGNAPTNTDYWMCLAATPNIELRKEGAFIQWRTPDGEWENLIALSAIALESEPVPSPFVKDIRTGTASLSVNPSKGSTQTLTTQMRFDPVRTTIPSYVFVTATDAFSPLKMWNFSSSDYTTEGFKLHMARVETTSNTSGTVPICYCAI